MKLIRILPWLLIPLVTLGWLLSSPPEGHIETAGHADGVVYAYTETAVVNVLGTAHNGGASLGVANVRGIVYSIYRWKDVNRNQAADANDEPIGITTLDGGINDTVATINLVKGSFFLSTGFIKIGTEVIKYTGRTANQLTGCTRGYNETTAASHLTATTVEAIQVWELILTVVCDGAPYDVFGWDAGQGADGGTEGDLLQRGSQTVAQGEYWLWKIRVVDANGNTNTEVAAIDVFATFGTNAYVGADGNVDLGLEDDEVWQFRVNKRPR